MCEVKDSTHEQNSHRCQGKTQKFFKKPLMIEGNIQIMRENRILGEFQIYDINSIIDRTYCW